jgi:hypothetical protein
MHALLITLLLCLLPVRATAQFAIDPSVGIWVNPAELAQLPMSGNAWDEILAAATQPCATPDLMDQGDDADACVLAKAIVSVRLSLAGLQVQSDALRADVLSVLGQMMDESNWCENGLCEPCDLPPATTCTTRRTLALGRNLGAYLAAAELIAIGPGDTPSRDELIAFLEGTGDPGDPEEIRIGVLEYQWVDAGTFESPITRRRLRETHNERPNNWGGHACASAAAAAIFRDNEAELLQIYDVARGWLGDCSQGDCSQFEFDEEAADWTCDQTPPTSGINESEDCWVDVSPSPYTTDLLNLSGVQVDDMRRAGPFPAGCDSHPRGCVADVHIWGGLQGRFSCAFILLRQGLDLFSVSDQALRRSYNFQHLPIWTIAGVPGQSHPPHVAQDGGPNDDAFLAYIASYVYGASYPLDPDPSESGHRDFGKGFGWTRYTLGENPCVFLRNDGDFDNVCNPVPVPPWSLAAAASSLLILAMRWLRPGRRSP